MFDQLFFIGLSVVALGAVYILSICCCSELSREELKKRWSRYRVSKNSYTADQLYPDEANGYHAAGQLLWKHDFGIGWSCLLLVENREGQWVLSVPGGKREWYDDCSENTARREFNEETFQNVHVDNDVYDDVHLVTWLPSGKYVLHHFVCTEDQLTINTSNTMWVPLRRLQDDTVGYPLSFSVNAMVQSFNPVMEFSTSSTVGLSRGSSCSIRSTIARGEGEVDQSL